MSRPSITVAPMYGMNSANAASAPHNSAFGIPMRIMMSVTAIPSTTLTSATVKR